jgi:hypothetical protein
METFCTDTRKHAEKLLIFSETTWNLLSFLKIEISLNGITG